MNSLLKYGMTGAALILITGVTHKYLALPIINLQSSLCGKPAEAYC